MSPWKKKKDMHLVCLLYYIFVMITDGPELINIQSRAIKLALVMFRLSRARAANCPYLASSCWSPAHA